MKRVTPVNLSLAAGVTPTTVVAIPQGATEVSITLTDPSLTIRVKHSAIAAVAGINSSSVVLVPAPLETGLAVSYLVGHDGVGAQPALLEYWTS